MPSNTRFRAGWLTAALFPLALQADDSHSLSPLVVTAPLMDDPLTVTSDPHQPRLPLPADDGGSYLKAIPGFSLSRKGGTSGDPELRGQGGSRLTIQSDDSLILGGCGGRMDPPTAYIQPRTYDRITILKGPQSVRHGAQMAGVVKFERDTPRFDQPTTEGRVSFTSGSFSRSELNTDVTTGGQGGFLRLLGTLSSQEDYRDGGGDSVHSRYQRWSTTAIAGWTPDEHTEVTFGHDRGDGFAAYDDRERDGTRFDRTGYTLKASRDDLSPLLARVEGQLFQNYVDHWMDSYRLIDDPPTGMAMDNPTMNPDRLTRGARLAAVLAPGDALRLTVGGDHTVNEHTTRMNLTQARNDTAQFTDTGLFVELEQRLSRRDRLDYGLRMDRSEAEALREGMTSYGGAEAGTTSRNSLNSGFIRYSRGLAALPATASVGLGHAERAPDFWERNRDFSADPERLTQLDLGLAWRSRDLRATASLFYGEFNDYLLIQREPVSTVHNIEASHYGLEGDLTYRLGAALSTTATVSYVRADNDTDNQPLAQTPPLEGTLSLDYDNGRQFGGALYRAVAKQDRIHEGYGTIYSVDSEATAGFGVFSLYAGHRVTGFFTATLGIDNLFDATYAEHIQQTGAAAYDGATAKPINEPGRTLWMTLATTF